MIATVFDNRPCKLGEGPLWHPQRQQLFWFDILSKQLLTQVDGTPHHWQFDEYVSAAGWIDINTLLLASETGLHCFDINSGDMHMLCEIEADNPVTRSNDGRADPWGGFWIGTMGKNAEPKAGSIYRYYRGDLKQVATGITISNAICFSPDRLNAYYCDTKTTRIVKVALNPQTGWPEGEAQTYVDLSPQGLNPDGAVVDADGCLWNAQWGAGRVARYDPSGAFLSAVNVGGTQASCPAFGGADLKTLFITTARDGLNGEGDGLTYAIQTKTQGQAEHQVILEP